MRIAREIDENGEYTLGGDNILAKSKSGNPAATWHGVTIVYASGRTRVVHAA